jgi:hypothetical protein
MEFFFSQHEFASKKLKSYGCGVAAMMMLLRYWCDRRSIPKDEDLAAALWAHVSPRLKGFQKSYGYGVDFDDVIMFLKRLKIPHNQTASSKKGKTGHERALRNALPAMVGQGPVMAAVSGHTRVWSGGHWIVLHALRDNKVWFCDPGYERADSKFTGVMTISRFGKFWTGYSIQIYGLSKSTRAWPPLEI